MNWEFCICGKSNGLKINNFLEDEELHRHIGYKVDEKVLTQCKNVAQETCQEICKVLRKTK